MVRLRHALLALVLAACAREPERPPVVLISIDTLRSDRLGTRTPQLRRLAEDAITFESAWSHVPLTLPSHASMLTGLLPPEHGVRDNGGYRLDPRTPTMASMLRGHGYATGGAVSAYVLRAGTNIGTGFDAYDDRIAFVEGAPSGALWRRGRETVAVATKWLDAHASQPFFLFVHLFEPHSPYESTYDDDVNDADTITGSLLEHLRERGLYDDALIIVTSDHGEGLRDHGEEEHGILLYREAIQVPLLVKLPRNERGGERVATPAQLIDLLPTVARVTGATPPPRLRGQSLLDVKEARPIYGETFYPRIHLGWSELRSLVRGRHHLIDGPRPELYDLATDPFERLDLRESQRRIYTQLRTDLAAMPQRTAPAMRVSPEEAKKLAALGYLSGTAPVASGNNPRDHLGDLDERKAVNDLLQRGDLKTAAERMETLLWKHPGWSDIRDELGHTYQRMGDLANAERTYREALRITPELGPDFALSLAGVLLAAGKLDEAEEHARVAATQSAQTGAAQLVLAQIRAARRDRPGALAILDAIPPPYPPRYHAVRGDVLGSLGRTDEAVRDFEAALRLSPRDIDAYVRLALLQRIGGDLASSRATLARMVAAVPETGALAARLEKEWAGVRGNRDETAPTSPARLDRSRQGE